MSAPQTNLPTQKRWHLAPIIGMVATVVFALGLLFWQMMVVADGTTAPDGTPRKTPAADLNDAVPESVPVPENPVPASPVTPTPADPAQVPGGAMPAPATPAPATPAPAKPVPVPGQLGTGGQQPAPAGN